MITIQYVPHNFIHHAWPEVDKFLWDALEKAECTEYGIDQLKAFVAQGQQDLFIAVNEENQVQGAATVSFMNYPNHRIAFVTAIGGKLFTNKETWDQFVSLLKLKGATRVQGAARESIARLWRRYGFKERHVIVEADI